jgi:hypothetical protein
MALAGREERAGQVRNDHSCSVYDGSRVQNGVGPIVCRNLRRSCKIRITQLAREGLRRRACAYSGEGITEFQSDSARTDSAVRILNAQPCSQPPGAVRAVIGRAIAACQENLHMCDVAHTHLSFTLGILPINKNTVPSTG